MVNVKDILSFLSENCFEFEYVENKTNVIQGFSSLNKAKNNSIVWIKNIERYVLPDDLQLLVICQEHEFSNMCSNYIFCNNPREIYFEILKEFFVTDKKRDTIGINSVVKSNDIGHNVAIGCNCYIGDEVVIGDNVIIENNVSIDNKVVIGDNTSISSGVVIGSDGYGYYKTSNGANKKIPHFGGVLIGSNVDIGANTCIDRGTIDDTIISDGVKIDNLCHIAHNVIIEENVNVIALSMIAGSVVLKKNSYVAPCSAILNQLTVGKDSLVGMGAVVLKNVDNNTVVAGVPATVIKKNGE